MNAEGGSCFLDDKKGSFSLFVRKWRVRIVSRSFCNRGPRRTNSLRLTTPSPMPWADLKCFQGPKVHERAAGGQRVGALSGTVVCAAPQLGTKPAASLEPITTGIHDSLGVPMIPRDVNVRNGQSSRRHCKTGMPCAIVH